MESKTLHQQVIRMRQALFDEELLDKQFAQLEQLEDDDNPNFVEEVVALFFRDSIKYFKSIEQALEKTPMEFIKLEKFLHQFKGSSSSVGAIMVKMECNQIREYCQEGNVEGGKAAFKRMKEKHEILRKKLETYFQMARQVGPVETAMRPK